MVKSFNAGARRRSVVFAVSAAAAAMIAAAPASAQNATATMAVGATVTNNCTVSATPVAFGNVDVTAGNPIDGTGGVAVTCTNGTAWTAAADAGQAAGATPAARQMTSASGGVLNYALFADSARTTPWGDGSAGTAPMAGTGTGDVQNAVVYASILPGQRSAAAGSYVDQINVTITY